MEVIKIKISAFHQRLAKIRFAAEKSCLIDVISGVEDEFCANPF